MDCQKPFYDPFSSTFNLCVYTFSFLVSMIRFLFVLGNFLEDPSVKQFCDVGILIKDYSQVVFFLTLMLCGANNCNCNQ